MSDLSYATIKCADLTEAVFYKANLYQTKFSDCNLQKANFREAYMANVGFKAPCKLEGANFAGAWGIPDSITPHLDKEGVYHENLAEKDKRNSEIEADRKDTGEKPIDKKDTGKKVFISCAGTLTPKQGEFVDKIKYDLEKQGVTSVQFNQSKYRETGQLSAIKTEMASCHGVISIGFPDYEIVTGYYRKGTNNTKDVKGKAFTTPWINIEMGIAYTLGLPIMMLYDAQIIHDGLFEPNIIDKSITRIDFQSVNYDEYEDVILNWITSLTAESK